MTIGLLGKKCGMTRIFKDTGEAIPVTVIHVEPNRITQIKTEETDGYNALQVTIGKRRATRVNQPMSGHYAKAGVEPGIGLWEFALEEGDTLEGVELASELTVDLFTEGQFVDVAGMTKGKGFAGAVKRHHFRTQDATHGNSLSHRAPGSIGQNQTPGRVFKGKKMAGHMGNKRRTVQNLEIVKIDKEKNVLLVKGSVAGAPSGVVIIIPAQKKAKGKGE